MNLWFDAYALPGQIWQVNLRVDAARTLVFCQRHQADPDHEYTPPHKINKHAIIWALHQLGCSKIVAFCSVGSLSVTLPVGSMMVPDDYYDPMSGPITFAYMSLFRNPNIS
jgi:purine nucleoside phosphorylase